MQYTIDAICDHLVKWTSNEDDSALIFAITDDERQEVIEL